MAELIIGNIKISQNGIITKGTLLVLGGSLIISGVYDIKITRLLLNGSIEVLLGGFLILLREYCKSIPDGCTIDTLKDQDNASNKGDRRW